MNNEIQEILFDLLTKQATYGLDATEQKQLNQLSASNDFSIDESFELAAAAISLSEITINEPMPAHLYSKILANSYNFLGYASASVEAAWPPPATADDIQPTFAFEPKRSSWSWLGWAVASVACFALAVNVYTTRFEKQVNVVTGPTPVASPDKPNPAKQYEEILASANVIKASFGPAPKAPAELARVGGDVVWSDAKQAGYMKLRGLPKNDKGVSTYQLWVFDETQDAKTPIDGGTFDVNADGEIIIPINAKLTAKNPKLFAITIEKPGGVVVSERKKMAALASVVKIET